MRIVLILAIAMLSTASRAVDLRSHPDPKLLAMMAFVDHYKSTRGPKHVRGQCFAKLTLDGAGYLTSIELACPSSEDRQVVYQRLAAAVPFPTPLPPGPHPGIHVVSGSF